MLSFLPQWLRGVLAVVLMFVNTFINVIPIVIASLIKLIIPGKAVGKASTVVAIWFASLWVTFNSLFLAMLHRIDWRISGGEGLSTKGWYLVTSNHQTWADIPVVQHAMNGRIPFIKFFLKQELIWVPLLGTAWWALDFPFMKRYSREYLEKHPEMKGKDLETTRKACEKFKFTPVTVFNFLEGTRFTESKHRNQQSPYKNLLKPKAGGIAFVLGAMGKELDTLLDINIVYPNGNKGFWGLLSGHLTTIVVDIRKIPIPAEFCGKDYAEDEQFREQFQLWVGDIWAEKDARLTKLKAQYAAK